MKKKIILLVSVFAFLLLSCSNFSAGSELRKEIEKAIDYANQKSFYIAINPSISESVLNILPGRRVEVKKTDVFTIETEISDDYVFNEIRVYEKSESTVIENADRFLKIGKPQGKVSGNSIIISIEIEILEYNNDLEIVLVCSPKQDRCPPEFYEKDDKAFKLINQSTSQEFEPAKFENGQLVKASDNLTNQSSVLLDCYVIDDVKPEKIWIRETEIFQKGQPVSYHGRDPFIYDLYIDIETDEFKKNVYHINYPYEFQIKGDGSVILEVKVIDSSNNISSAVKTYIINRDTQINWEFVPFQFYDGFRIPEGTKASDYPDIFLINTELEFEELDSSLSTIYFEAPVDRYQNGDSLDNYFIENFTLSWGNTEECLSNSISSNELETEIKYGYFYNEQGVFSKMDSFKYLLYKVTLDEDLFYDDVYLKIEVTDKVGNTKVFKEYIPGDFSIESIDCDSDLLHIHVNQEISNKWNTLTGNDNYSLEGNIYYSIGNSSDIHLLGSGYNTFSIDMDWNLFVDDFATVAPDTVIGYVYIQVRNSFYGRRHQLRSRIKKIELKKKDMQDFSFWNDPDCNLINLNINDYISHHLADGGENKSWYSSIDLPENLLNEYRWEFVQSTNNGFKEIDSANICSPNWYSVRALDSNDNVVYKNTIKIEIPETPEFDLVPPLYPSYSSFTLANVNTDIYSGSGFTLLYYDDNSIKQDEYGIPFINVKFLPHKEFPAYYAVWTVNSDNYPFTKINSYLKLSQIDYVKWLKQKKDFDIFVVPLYMMEENTKYQIASQAFDNSPNENSIIMGDGGFAWYRTKKNPVITYSESESGKISINNIFTISDYSFEEIDPSSNMIEHYLYNIDKLTSGDYYWQNTVCSGEQDIPNNGTTIDFSAEIDKTEGSFFRYKSTYSTGTEDITKFCNHSVFSKPVYFYGKQEDCSVKNLFAGTNSAQVIYDKPVLIQTYYADRNLGGKLSEWEMLAADCNPVVFKPQNGSTTTSYYYYDNAENSTHHIPDEYYYVVAAYFADGTKTWTAPAQKNWLFAGSED